MNERVKILSDRAATHSYEFRKQFVGEIVEVLVEQLHPDATLRHGRCERYFDVEFESANFAAGDSVNLRIETVEPDRTRAKLAARPQNTSE